jgi:transposase
MQGLLLHAIVHSAGVQDRDGGIWLLATLFGQFPFLAKLFADSAYAGSIFHTALGKVLPNLKTEIVRRSDRAKGFVPLPKRWIVERTSIGRISIAALSLSSNSLPSASCCESYAILDEVPGRTLNLDR